MTIDEMFNELDDKVRDTFIVTLKYKYDFEEYYTIGNHILEYDCLDDSYVWLDDWNEGQTDVEVLGYMPLGDVDTTKLLTCEDCISREAAIDAIRKNTFRLTFAEEQNCEGHVAWSAEAVYSDVLEGALLSLPSVTPQPKVGEWIDKGYDIGNCWATCSECDGDARGYAKDTGWGHDYYFLKFCPHCGARMTVDEERLCRTCQYGNKSEYQKPCVVYRDDCHLYEKKEEHNKMSKRDKLIAGSDVIFVESPPYGFDLKGWLSSFNTDSATECFTAVQELKKRLEDKNE